MKNERAELISQCVRENAEGEFDLDPDLKQASVENLLSVDEINK